MSERKQYLREEELRDLGFGSIVSRESSTRLLNRDGSFNVRRVGMGFWNSMSVYHWLLSMAWWQLIAVIAVAYVAINLLFAGAYMLAGPQALSGSDGITGFLRAFFFSVHTFSTVGYGAINPATIAANMIVTVETLVGLLAFALATGVIFARFSRPTARILFSNHAVIAPYRGTTAFEFRIANARQNQLIDVQAKVLLTRFEEEGGQRNRKYYTLSLERDNVTFFPLSWTIVHPIDDQSPLYGATPQHLEESGAEFLVLLSGTDETFAQTVHARSSYVMSELVWGAKFGNIFSRSGDAVAIDIRRFHEIQVAELRLPDAEKL